MEKQLLVIGNGGREHALCWKLSQSPQVKQIYALPGSYAIEQVPKVKNLNLNVKNFPEIVDFCLKQKIDLVVVGPEDPLANGIADELFKVGIHCFGPEKKAANIESDKSWAKNFMDKYGIPSAKWKSFTNADEAKKYIQTATHKALVIKASGLAAGKGVVVAKDKNEACDAVNEMLVNKKFGSAGEIIVVEELLEGEEVSVLAFTDGKTIKAMLPSQDHKRIHENDEGLNTGGMGAYCPYPLREEDMKFIENEVLNKALIGLQQEKLRYVGVLYAGLMLTKSGPKILEFNCRFGDPETQVILPLLESDLYQIMYSCCTGNLKGQNIEWRKGLYAVGVVMASRGYPESSSKGQVITGINDVSQLSNHIVFHSGTALNANNELVTNGGRVLISVALESNLTLATVKATRVCTDIIKFDGSQYRRDIAHKGIARVIVQMGDLSYKKSGVDIEAGDSLVTKIKPLAKSTVRTGLMGDLGGFGGLFDIKAANFKDPILVSGTDGVGTKLKIAKACNIHSTIGIDLVAMCVNDVLAHGAEPLFFLDYFSCGTLDVKVATDVVSGIAEGCRQAGCALIGGETAEMPGMYAKGDYDLAGFAVGAVERNQMIPRISDIVDGDIVIGFPSSGVHSNGFSLVRRIIQMANMSYNDVAPFSSTGKTIGEELLAPTKIYVKTILPLIKSGFVKAFAHITGGGLLENIPRILPKNVQIELNAESWKVPSIFGWLAAVGGVNEYEMLRTFNCGIGCVIIIDKSHYDSVLKILTNDDQANVIGCVKLRKDSNQSQVIVKNSQNVFVEQMKPYIRTFVELNGTIKKKVGVLISGSGTNLQTLINATQDPTQQMGAEIVLVISNKPNVEGLKRAERANIKTVVIKHSDFPTRESFDAEMSKELEAAGVEIVCLAGFMRILSEQFVRKWHGRLINIHPSLLPLFKGVHAQRQALEAGVKVSGCSVHFVEVDIDAGAIICQEAVPIYPNDTEEDLIERIKAEGEQKAYPKALKLLATNKISLGSDNKIVYH